MQMPGTLSILKLLVRTLAGFEKQLERQNALLERLADAIAPLPPEPSGEPDVMDTDMAELAKEEQKEEREKYGYQPEESWRTRWNSPLPGG